MRDFVGSALITPTTATSGFVHLSDGGSISFTCRDMYRRTAGSVLEHYGLWVENAPGQNANWTWIVSGVLDVVKDEEGYALTMVINDLIPAVPEAVMNRVSICGRVSDPFAQKNGFLSGMIYVPTGKGTGAKFPVKIWGEMAMTAKILAKATFEKQMIMSFVGSLKFSEYNGRVYYSMNTSGYPTLSLPLTSEYYE